MKIYVTVTLKSGARIIGDIQAESVEAAVRRLDKALDEPRLYLDAKEDRLIVTTGEVASFQVSPNKP